jgi:ubiquitin-like-conjugating enzyme ATG10
MSASHRNRDTYQCYPYLTQEEFTEVCHHLDNKYCQATLGPIRKQWRLRVHTALDMSFAADSDYTTFLQITRPLDDTASLDDLESFLNNFSMNEVDGGSRGTADTMEIDESDQVRCLSGSSDLRLGQSSSYMTGGTPQAAFSAQLWSR